MLVGLGCFYSVLFVSMDCCGIHYGISVVWNTWHIETVNDNNHYMFMCNDY